MPILAGGVALDCLQVSDPLATKGVDWVQRSHATSAHGNVCRSNVGSLLSIVGTKRGASAAVDFLECAAALAGDGALENGDSHRVALL